MPIHPKKRNQQTAVLLFGALSAIAFSLFLLRSDIAIEYMKKGLKLCAYTVIPSLFPFMVISELLISGGVGQMVSALLAKPAKWLFGVSKGGACAFVLGAVCGFPIGARTLCSLYDKGEISKEEFEHVLMFCNNPGSAFVISAVGISLFGSKRIGMILYTCVLLSAVIVGIVSRAFCSGKHIILNSNDSILESNDIIVISKFTSAIQNSALAMLTVCAYVAFFSSFVGCIGAIISQIKLPQEISAWIFGFFELSSGVGMATEVYDPMSALLLCALALGWSGLSVHFQVMTICSGRGISFKPYFIAKAAQGVICAVLTAACIKLIPFASEAFAQISFASASQRAYTNAAFVCSVFFAATICPILFSAILGAKKYFQKNKNIFQKGVDKSKFV